MVFVLAFSSWHGCSTGIVGIKMGLPSVAGKVVNGTQTFITNTVIKFINMMFLRFNQTNWNNVMSAVLSNQNWPYLQAPNKIRDRGYHCKREQIYIRISTYLPSAAVGILAVRQKSYGTGSSPSIFHASHRRGRIASVRAQTLPFPRTEPFGERIKGPTE